MNYKKIALVSLVGLSVGTSVVARDFGNSSDRLANALELDDAQVTAIEEIFTSHKEEAQAELEAVLTPEQLEQYNAMREERQDGNRGRKRNRSDSDV